MLPALDPLKNGGGLAADKYRGALLNKRLSRIFMIFSLTTMYVVGGFQI
jgi:hypothetical protein